MLLFHRNEADQAVAIGNNVAAGGPKCPRTSVSLVASGGTLWWVCNYDEENSDAYRVDS